MGDDRSDLEALWNSAPVDGRLFDPRSLARLPEAAQRYLAHAIAGGTPLASAVRLRMHGAIRLSRWWPFRAEQVIVRDGGMVWRATVRMRGVAIRGFDRLRNGAGAMQWRIFGLIPLIRAAGPDITRSAAGRVAAESIWLPSMLCGAGVSWQGTDASVARARFAVEGYPVDVSFVFDQGCVRSVVLPRWGNPDGGVFREIDFGALVEQEATFAGYTIPVRLRAGWYFGDERFASEGEFLRVTIDDAAYR
jgi:hypothetical protein